jgi:uncharacterized SAM-binding protein YcdF (DUF218 family)
MKEVLKKLFSKQRLIRWSIYSLIFLLMYLFRYPILRSAGNFLIHEDTPEICDAVFVLGGSSLERGIEAKKIYDSGYSKCFITTGHNIPNLLKAINQPLTEAEVTAHYLLLNGLPPEYIDTLDAGTSTREEAMAVFEYCKQKKYNKVMILSSRFHTRRVYNEFKKVFNGSTVDFIVHGAPSVVYKEDEWWKYEEGMIMVNNEYMKMLYYLFK